jgi:hypothetical protein
MALLAGSTATAATTSPAPTVTDTPTGSPTVGTLLTATPVTAGDEIDWATCDDLGNQIGTTYLATDTTTYTLTTSNANTYVCAIEPTSTAGTTYVSAPVGPVPPDLTGTGPTLSAPASVVQGDVLTVAHGAWDSGATISDHWEDCNSAGAACVAISGATASSYTVARSDANDKIAVLETATENGASVSKTTAPTGLVSATAPTPSSTNPPTVSGAPQVGQTLTASPGTWSNDPTAYAYSWERCSAAACTTIPNATDPTYVVSTADIGSELEVLVTASVFSTQGIAYPSYPTDAVPGITDTTGTTGTTGSATGSSGVTSSPVTHSHTPKKLLGRLTPTMQWTFHYAPSFTQVIALDSQGTAVGSTVTVRCAGKGCPFTKRREAVNQSTHCGTNGTHACRSAKTVDLEPEFRGRDLRVGAQVTVTITRRRYVGKYFRFTVRARKQPAVRISCLAPGSNTPGKDCTSF